MIKLNVPGPKAQALIDRDKKVISSSYPRGYPFVMDHGKGVEVWDPDGNRFIDFMSGIAVLSTGHANPKVVKQFKMQPRNSCISRPTFIMKVGYVSVKSWTRSPPLKKKQKHF